MTPQLSAGQIKAEASRLGFSACGLAQAGTVDGKNANAFREWIANGRQGQMSYMQNHADIRLDPGLLVDGARTVISLALNYYPVIKLPEKEYQIAWYAYGKDYHEVMKAKLRTLSAFIMRTYGRSHIRIFCDSAPVLERYWAWRAGLGWIGKNTQLILPHAGSCFFLGEIVTDATADRYDLPHENRCGTCTRCMDVCPTRALEAPFRLNSSKCLSYLTIEYRGELPAETKSKMGENIYGCDGCQRTCPWNRFATPCRTKEFAPSQNLLDMRKKDWHTLSEEEYRKLFKGSAVERTKYQGLIRNIRAHTDWEPSPLK